MARDKILTLLGSTKQDSINKQILDYVSAQLSKHYEMVAFDMTTLPYFNPSLDTEIYLPQSVRNFRNVLENARGVLICTPEYVFSMPGILKNALEWMVSTMLWDQKPTAVITAASSGAMAHESLLLVLQTIGANIGEASSALISAPKSKFDTSGTPIDPQTAAQMEGLVEEFKQLMSTMSKI